MVFRGNFPAKIDPQGRIKIPTAHRKILEENYGPELFITSINGRNILIYPMLEWEKLEAKLMEGPKMLPSKIKFLRNTSYYGQASTMDRQGRVSIQGLLRESAQVDGEEVAVMGQLNNLEVWNLTRFKEILESDPYTDDDARDLAELGI